MRKKNFKGRCEKRQVSKCEDVCRTYDAIQRAHLDKLEANKNIKSMIKMSGIQTMGSDGHGDQHQH